MTYFTKKYYEYFAEQIRNTPNYKFPMTRMELADWLGQQFARDSDNFTAHKFITACKKEKV